MSSRVPPEQEPCSVAAQVASKGIQIGKLLIEQSYGFRHRFAIDAQARMLVRDRDLSVQWSRGFGRNGAPRGGANFRTHA